jgi:hypothetical protein
MKYFFLIVIAILAVVSCQKEEHQLLNLNLEGITEAKGGKGGETVLYSETKTFTSEWRFDWSVEAGKTYGIRISGLYSDGGGANNLDAAFDLRGNVPYNSCDPNGQSRWRFINQCDLRPDIDAVTTSHVYNYTFVPSSALVSFDFKDCCYGDNSGQLTFELIQPSDAGGNKPTVDISKGLIAYYPFNGDATDNSGNGHNGQVSGAILTTDRNGKNNSAYLFKNNPDNITIPTITQNNILEYTVSGWFQKNSNSNNYEGTLFSGSNPCNGPGGLRLHVGSDNYVAWGAEFQYCSSVWQYSSNKNFADDKWHHFVAVLTANSGIISSSELVLYVDNALQPTSPKYWGDQNNVTAPINSQGIATTLGNTIYLNDYFQGKIDEIRIHNRAISSKEVEYLYKLRK